MLTGRNNRVKALTEAGVYLDVALRDLARAQNCFENLGFLDLADEIGIKWNALYSLWNSKLPELLAKEG